MGYTYGKEVLASWRESGEFQKMIPALYKRARSASVSSSGISSLYRKGRSASIGNADSKEHEDSIGKNNIDQNSWLIDSGVAEVPVKRVS